MNQKPLPPVPQRWVKLVARAQRSIILAEPLAITVTGLTHKEAREILALEQKRMELKRKAVIERSIVRHNL